MKVVPILSGVVGMGMALLSGCAHAVEPQLRLVHLSAKARAAVSALIDERPGERSARAIAATGSMEPTFDENFIVVVEARPFSELRIGDIPAVYYFDEVLAHRIVSDRGPGWYTTKGDALRYVDDLAVTRLDYTGMVIIAAVEAHTGEVRRMSSKPREWDRYAEAETAPASRRVAADRVVPALIRPTSGAHAQTPAVPQFSSASLNDSAAAGSL